MHAPPAETAAKSSAIMAGAKDDAFPLPRVRLVGAHSSRTFNSHARLLSADTHMPRPREAPEAARSPRRAFGLSKHALCTRSILTRACSQPTHTCRPPKPSQHSESRASHFTENHLPRDYFLPVSFSRHAAQAPSPVSRRDAGSCLPTRRIASIASSAGMISPTPEGAGFAAHGAEGRNLHAPRLLSPRLVQPARRAAALAGFAQGRGKLPPHAAHRVDHLVRGHDQSHARGRGVRGAWR